jgi:hypothetical protein
MNLEISQSINRRRRFTKKRAHELRPERAIFMPMTTIRCAVIVTNGLGKSFLSVLTFWAD